MKCEIAGLSGRSSWVRGFVGSSDRCVILFSGVARQLQGVLLHPITRISHVPTLKASARLEHYPTQGGWLDRSQNSH